MDGTTNALQISVNNRIKENTYDSHNRYNNQYQSARYYYHYVGMEDDSSLTMLEEGQTYTMFINLRASRAGIKYRVKVGDYRHGHWQPIWEAKKTKISENN